MTSTRSLVAAALGLFAFAGRAATPAKFELQSFDPAPAGDRFFAVPSASIEGDLEPAGSLVLSYARKPLVLRHGGTEIPGGHLVSNQLWGWANASLSVAGRALFDLSVPVALSQQGEHPWATLPRVSSAGFGDVRLGVRTGLLFDPRFELATGLDLYVPTGARSAFASDGSVRLQPKVMASGAAGSLRWAASLGYLERRSIDVGYAGVHPAMSFSAGIAWERGAIRLGPEVFGRLGAGDVSPVEALLGGSFRTGDLTLGLAMGTGLNRDPGAAPIRVVGSATWRSGSR